MASRFKRQPRSEQKQEGEPDPKDVARFGAGALHHEATEQERLRAVNVRLTEAELDILRRLAKAEDRSMQRTIRRLLMSAAESELKRLFGTI